MSMNTIPTYSNNILSSSSLCKVVAGLPPLCLTDRLRSEADFYGASALIARKAQLIDLPASGINWVHGWKYGDVSNAEQIGGYYHKKRLHLVSHAKHQEILCSEGFRHVQAVGLPYLYADCNMRLNRLKGSLLVCPGHTSPYATDQDWSQIAREYASRICDIKENFSEILICLSANCIEQKKWTREFEAVGIPWILGASIYDRNALIRMRNLFRQFEFVTTNCVGSHVVYASYEGCKVSICGWQDLYKPKDFVDEPMYKGKKELLQACMRWGSKAWIQENFSYLFQRNPLDANVLREWAEIQLGEKYKKSPCYIAGLFAQHRKKHFTSRLITMLTPKKDPLLAYKKMRTNYRTKCDFSLSAISDAELKKNERLRKTLWRRQKKQLLRSPRYVGGFVQLMGTPFRYLDTHSLAYTVDHIFNRGVYAFDCASETPYIIDAGANIGVSLLYFKRRFPGSRVICFEPDPKVFSTLELNARTYGIENCDLHCAALWSRNTMLEFCAEGADAGSIKDVGGNGTPTFVRALDLRPYLQGQSVDFLKMDIEGAELEVLRACQVELKNVKRIFIEYHSFKGRNQRLAELFQILEGAGFRVHLNNVGLCSKQPMLDIGTELGMDMQFDLFGYRV